MQYAFINERSVLCPALSFAVKDAFGTRIAHDRFPIYALHLDIPYDFLDVNVHPQKKEVRIREEKWIKGKIQEAIQEELFLKERVHSPSPLSSDPLSFNLFSPSSFFSKPKEEEIMLPLPQEELFVFPEEMAQMPLFQEKKVIPLGLYRHYLWIYASSIRDLNLNIPTEGVIAIDLKAASSRLLFESLEEEKTSSLPLLLPLSFSCSLAEAESLLLHIQELEEMGFSLRSVGRQSFLIDAIPSLLPEEEALDFLKIAFLSEKADSWKSKKERLVASACSKLISQRKEPYELQAAIEIFYQLVKAKTPLFCPLGNKTLIQIGDHELEQMFIKRK